MNLLAYTKKISQKIRYYDAIAKNTFSGINMTNPFAKPINITIVWIDENCPNKDE